MQELLRHLRDSSTNGVCDVKPPGILIYDTELKFDPQKLFELLSVRSSRSHVANEDPVVERQRLDQLMALVKVFRLEMWEIRLLFSLLILINIYNYLYWSG